MRLCPRWLQPCQCYTSPHLGGIHDLSSPTLSTPAMHSKMRLLTLWYHHTKVCMYIISLISILLIIQYMYNQVYIVLAKCSASSITSILTRKTIARCVDTIFIGHINRSVLITLWHSKCHCWWTMWESCELMLSFIPLTHWHEYEARYSYEFTVTKKSNAI